MDKILDIKIPKSQLEGFCKKHYITKLSMFGSFTKGNYNENSDIDFLVEFKNGHTPGLIGLNRIQRELSDLLGGKKVDLRTVNELSRYFRDEVISTALVQYEE
ncbi:MAG: nucleotidyltransferase family protein [Ignavibacteria bacterium]